MVDVVKVAEIWPEADDTDRPTPRAIRERLGIIRKQAGIKNPFRTTGSGVTLASVQSTKAETLNTSSTQTASRLKTGFDDTDMPGTQKPHEELNFIRSSFPTSFRTTGKTNKTQGGTNKRKRADDSSDEDEAMSTSGSESEADVPERESTAPLSSRSSARRRTTNPKYDLKDLQNSSDDESQKAGSDDSDAGYNPVTEYEKDKAKREKRCRPHKVGRLGENEAEEARCRRERQHK